MRWTRLSVAHIGGMRSAYKNVVGKTEERDHVEDLDVDEVL
jgi:hypothetical protein